MATNEQIITDHLAALKARADSYVTLTESYLSDLKSAAYNFQNVANPSVAYVTPSVTQATQSTAITADFNSGIGYPSSSALLQAAIAGAYDSEFLEYLETATKNTPLASWGTALNSIRQTYRDSVTVSAQNYVTQFVPMSAAYQTACLSIVNDARSRNETDFALKWVAIMNEFAIQAQQEMLATGIKIEDVRERTIADMVQIYSDYNMALVDKARVDLEAKKQQAEIIRNYIESAIASHIAGTLQDFNVGKLTYEKNLFELDKWLAESSDFVQRTNVEWQLETARSAALVDFAKAAIAQSDLSKGTFTVYTSTSEA